jgi:membrane fusion protein (multidrug efflux system)
MYDSLQFDMHAKKANFELKRLNHDYTTIRAPISGVISSREIKVGRQVYESDPLFRITDTSQLVAQLKIPQTELPKFEPGQSMQLHVDAMPELPYTATVARISPTIDVANGTFRATAYIDNSDGKLAPGMFARFRIAYDKHENALVIPGTAVIQEDNISTVYVVADGEANRRVIETGIESGDLIEVIGGLDASESVVTTGLAGLTDGSRVLASNAAAQGGSG